MANTRRKKTPGTARKKTADAAVATSAVAIPRTRKVRRPDTQNSVGNTILERLGQLDSRIETLSTNTRADADAQITDALQQQTGVLNDVNITLQGLQDSLLSAVTNAVQSRLEEIAVAAPHTNQFGKSDASDHSAVDNESDGELSPESWGDIRSAFLKEYGESVDEEHELLESNSSNALPLSASEESSATVEDDPEMDLPEHHTIADPGVLNEDELRDAVIDQERMISALLNRLRKTSQKNQPLSADQLADITQNLPEQLEQRATETLQSLDNQLRYGELELSLERARISRQASRLEVTRERLDARARSMGLEISEDGTLVGGSSAPRDSKSRNWLGKLGFGN